MNLNCDIEISKAEHERRCYEYSLLGPVLNENIENSDSNKKENNADFILFYAACKAGRRPYGGTVEDSLKEITL